jgi:hypothetical protein
LAFFKNSVAFCNPVNKVQRINNNRVAESYCYNIQELLCLFEQGKRVDVDVYDGYIPTGCHQEINFIFEEKNE